MPREFEEGDPPGPGAGRLAHPLRGAGHRGHPTRTWGPCWPTSGTCRWTLHEAIAFHHAPDETSNQLRDCLYMANQITKRLAYGSAGNFEVEPIPDRVRDRFGMDMDELIEDLSTLDDEVENARIFIKLGEAH